jgi:transposase InsO family protein
VIVIFVDQHKEQYGVGPICRQIQIAPSSYYEHKARQRDPERLPDRIKRDRELERDIQRVWESNFKVSDRGSQYLSIRYTERLAEANIDASVGSVGDSYDNALAETINGLYKTEVIRNRSPWRNIDDVEFATLEWVDWFNNRRLLEPIGNIPPAEFEMAYYRQLVESVDAA